MTYLKKAGRLNHQFLISQIVFLIFTLVSFFLRHEGLSFFDASDFATAIQGWGIPHAPGYPLYVLLGKFFYLFTPTPFDAQFWVNILAAWIACFFLFKTLAANKTSALVAVLFLLAQGLFQQYILIPEVFTLNLSLVSALIYFHQSFDEKLQPRYVFAIGLVYGLGLCHHHLMVLMVPASAFLLIRGFSKNGWLKGSAFFLAGFMVGLLPLAYYFIATAHDPDYTYYSVKTLQDMLFVVLRKGYGTFQMTGTADGVPAWDIFKIIFEGVFQSGFAVVLLGALIAAPFFWGSRKSVPAAAVLSMSTVIIFVVAFCIMANFPVDSLEGKNVFVRYLTFPGFLLIYPLAYGWEQLSRKYGSKVYSVAGVIAVVAGSYSLVRLNYRHYSTIDFQIAQTYRAIERAMGPQPDTTIDPKINRCIVFGLSDPFHFGGRYYNEFQTNYRCYFFSIATVITGQFQARYELRLVQHLVEPSYSFAGKSRETILLDIFSRAILAGYRIFVMYPGDLNIFKIPDMQVTPIGSSLELKLPSSRVPLERVAQEHRDYLESLKMLLNEVERAPIQPRPVSVTSVQAPFMNLEVYAQLLKLSPELQAEHDQIKARAEKFLEHLGN
jgi:transmembrane protein TMEM260 (protein O-mannosyltransferase)